jgi:excisionase family DNA binding protein
MRQESKYIKILDRLEIILDWKWQATEEEGRRKDGKSITNTVNKLTLYTDKQAFTVWDSDGKIHGFPSFISAFSPDVEAGLPRNGDARPVNLFWDVEGGGTLCGYSGGIAYMLTRNLSPEEQERLKPNSVMKAEPYLLTIKQAAEYARVDERTIRDWLKKQNVNKPMLPGAIVQGRKIRILRTDLDPWRKGSKTIHTPKSIPRKRLKRKTVKRKT